jgi:alkane 1-monooxygenase
MVQALPYLLGFVLPPAVVVGAELGGPWVLLPAVLLFLESALLGNPWFRPIPWLWLPVQAALLVWGLRAVSGGGLTPLETIGVTLGTGLTTGAIGITFAHELIHRTDRLERLLGEVLLAGVGYTHFAIEHVHGHHRHVATPRDPASARLGEPFYRFVPRSVAGGLLGAWRIEVQRLRRRGRPAWHPSNRMLRYAATQPLLYAVVGWATGPAGMAFLAGQAAVAVFMLEVINYIEHYGLRRREIEPGRYERVRPWHSWDSSHRVSNWILINLARHADHHVVASKRYPMLSSLDRAPQLPAGYGLMFLVALAPPLWRRVMDPRVHAWRERHDETTDLPRDAVG